MRERLGDAEPLFAAAAQRVYAAWEQDEEGFDEEYGGGGICQDIADAIAGVIVDLSFDVEIMDAQVGEQHVWAVALSETEAWHVDIHPGVYETGGGYNWQKIPDVVFEPSDIIIFRGEREDFKNES